MSDRRDCPNIGSCQIFNEGFIPDQTRKQFYRTTYCTVNTSEGYLRCKRFQTSKTLGFCPDFLLPDSTMTIDEIMDKCEE